MTDWISRATDKGDELRALESLDHLRVMCFTLKAQMGPANADRMWENLDILEMWITKQPLKYGKNNYPGLGPWNLLDR
jgi:hypothetical protein